MSIHLLNSQDNTSLQTWINSPPINKPDCVDKLPSVPLLFYAIKHIDFTHHDHNENDKIALNNRMAHITDIPQKEDK